MRLSFVLPLIAIAALSACEDLAVMDDPDALMELRGNRACVRAVNAELGITSATPNTVLPVIEVNQYVIDVPGQGSWTCFTDDAQKAQALVKLPPPPVLDDA